MSAKRKALRGKTVSLHPDGYFYRIGIEQQHAAGNDVKAKIIGKIETWRRGVMVSSIPMPADDLLRILEWSIDVVNQNQERLGKKPKTVAVEGLSPAVSAALEQLVSQ